MEDDAFSYLKKRPNTVVYIKKLLFSRQTYFNQRQQSRSNSKCVNLSSKQRPDENELKMMKKENTTLEPEQFNATFNKTEKELNQNDKM